MLSLPDSEEPCQRHPEEEEAPNKLKPISSLRASEVLLPPPSMRSQSSISSNSANSILMGGEDSYAGATTGTSIDLRLPDYRFSVLSLTALSDCQQHQRSATREVDVLGYVTKVQGLREIRMKDSRVAKLFKLELSDDSSNAKALGVLTVSSWESTAEALNKDVQQGDILFLSRASIPSFLFLGTALMCFGWATGIALAWNRYEGCVSGTTTRRSTCQVCWRTRAVQGDQHQQEEELRPALGLAVQLRHAPSVKVAQTLEWAAASGLLIKS